MTVFRYLTLLSLACSCVAALGSDKDSVISEIRSAAQAGKPMGLSEFHELIQRPDVNLGFEDVGDCWKELESTQQPMITKQELADLVGKRIQTINSIHFAVHDSSSPNVTQNFWMQDNKLALQVADPSNPTSHTNKHIAYDGDHFRSLTYSHGGMPMGTVGGLPSKTPFFTRYNALASAALIDTRERLGSVVGFWDAYGLVQRPTTVVFETIDERDGSKRICISDNVNTLYLDIEKDFSVVEAASFRNGMRDGKLFIELHDHLENDLKQFGNGLWLPVESRFSRYEQGEKVEESTLVFADLTVNETIPETAFNDIFPKDAHVRDENVQFDKSVQQDAQLAEELFAQSADEVSEPDVQATPDEQPQRDEVTGFSAQADLTSRNWIFGAGIAGFLIFAVAVGAVIKKGRRV
jgi:hypothetical protein